jgi:hypothetical protein
MLRLLRDNEDANMYRLQLFTPFPGTELFHLAGTLGMKLPGSLKEWATYHYGKVSYDGFSRRHNQFLKDMHRYTFFLDDGLLNGIGKLFNLISTLYSRLLTFRIEHGFYRCMYELYPLKILQKARHRH